MVGNLCGVICGGQSVLGGAGLVGMRLVWILVWVQAVEWSTESEFV
jgi:hypothetical protein